MIQQNSPGGDPLQRNFTKGLAVESSRLLRHCPAWRPFHIPAAGGIVCAPNPSAAMER